MDTTVVFAADVPAATISDRVRRGQLVRLATGIYTSDVTSDPAAVVGREWHAIVGRMYPRAVITDRSAITGGPVEGLLYLAYDGRGREAELPGVTVLARAGAGPLDGDIALPGGLYQASKGRALQRGPWCAPRSVRAWACSARRNFMPARRYGHASSPSPRATPPARSAGTRSGPSKRSPDLKRKGAFSSSRQHARSGMTERSGEHLWGGRALLAGGDRQAPWQRTSSPPSAR